MFSLLQTTEIVFKPRVSEVVSLQLRRRGQDRPHPWRLLLLFSSNDGPAIGLVTSLLDSLILVQLIFVYSELCQMFQTFHAAEVLDASRVIPVQQAVILTLVD